MEDDYKTRAARHVVASIVAQKNKGYIPRRPYTERMVGFEQLTGKKRTAYNQILTDTFGESRYGNSHIEEPDLF